MQPEARLSKKILKALKANGGYWVKVHGSAMQTTGLPDIIGCYEGWFVGFEVKLPGRESTLSLRQSVNLRRIEHSGGVPHVVTSPEDALEVVLRLRKRSDDES